MIIFDFEVFKYDWLVVFYDTTDNNLIGIVNDVDQLNDYIKKNQRKLYVGFNTKHYDDLILKGLLLGESPKYISDKIIKENKTYKLYQIINFKSIDFYSLDISLDFMRGSLKEFEGYLGLNIAESEVSFEIGRKLTDEELKQSIEYCKQDVRATYELIKISKNSVLAKLQLIKHFGLPVRYISKTNTKLASIILNANNRLYTDELEPFKAPKELQLNNKEVYDFYCNNTIDYDKKLKIDIAGVPHILAYGGLHGAIKKYRHEGEMWVLDVASYYPSLMINYDYISRGIAKDGKERFIKIYHDRLNYKANGNDQLAFIYKIIINSVFGAMKDEYNGLYDPRQCNNVCILGQLLLIDLIEKLEPYCKLIQSNTDGIIIIPFNEQKITEIYHEWEQRTHMTLELKTGKALYQKDVNNYILVTDKEIKVRGSYVSQAKGCKTNNSGTKIRKTKSIIDTAVVQYFVNKVSPDITINNCNDLLEFQIITKTGKTYYKTVWNINDEEIEVNRVNRVYATKQTKYGKVYKYKQLENGIQKALIAGLPEHCYVDNKNKFTINDLDKDWYISETWNRINDFI